MCRRLILVGRAPSKLGEPQGPLPAIWTIVTVAGVDVQTYLKRTVRMNLLTPAEAAEPSDLMREGLMVEKAERLIGVFARYPVTPILLIGASVARAFDHRCRPLAWRYATLFGVFFPQVAILPNPGLAEWWNDPTNRKAARAFLRGAFFGKED